MANGGGSGEWGEARSKEITAGQANEAQSVTRLLLHSISHIPAIFPVRSVLILYAHQCFTCGLLYFSGQKFVCFFFSPRGICGRQCEAWTGFSPRTSVFLCQYLPTDDI